MHSRSLVSLGYEPEGQRELDGELLLRQHAVWGLAAVEQAEQ